MILCVVIDHGLRKNLIVFVPSEELSWLSIKVVT